MIGLTHRIPRIMALAGVLGLLWVSIPAAGLEDTGGAPAVPMARKLSDDVKDRLRGHIGYLSGPEMKGRGPGGPGLGPAARYIAEAFRSSGLTPGTPGGYVQTYCPDETQVTLPPEVPPSTPWGKLTLENVLGVIPGTDGPEAPCVVLGAHYDHLGVSKGGDYYPGADDNASGIAALLELANRMMLDGPYRNMVVFVAFSGEEEGLLGSRFFAQHPACPANRTRAMLNLDTVGRMEGRKLFVFGSGTGAELPKILQGVNLGQDLELAMPATGPFASDQIPFFEKGIPVLHFFSGPNPDYHRVSDTEERINYDGLLHVIDFVQEVAVDLAERDTPLTFVPPGADNARPPASAAPGPRKVSLGTIPDFGRESGGVLLTGVMPGSPAERAGLAKGDILIGLGGMPVDNLADFSAALKSHQPGDTVEVVVERGVEVLHRRLQLVERK